MLLRDFVSRVEAQHDLELVYSDPTMCILLCKSEGGERRIRLGPFRIVVIRTVPDADAFQAITASWMSVHMAPRLMRHHLVEPCQLQLPHSSSRHANGA